MPVRRIGRLVLDRTVDNFFAETEQVAFCTQNVVPGIDFTNDPLLQGRNFSYLDTQLKRLGGPNFTHIPVNAPKCPVAHFQQDGHMAMTNPVGRVNYEPNSCDRRTRPVLARTRSAATRASRSPSSGAKQRVRSERFADHYSQARQFYVSQTPIEQDHIVNAFVFELSKVEQPGIRARMVANLRNVDEAFAAAIADGLGLSSIPRRRTPARPPITDLPAVAGAEHRRQRTAYASPAARSACSSPTAPTPPLLTRRAAGGEQPRARVLELIAPKIGGVSAERRHATSRRTRTSTVDRRCCTTPSPSSPPPTAPRCSPRDAAAKDFVTDAHAHCKFIAHDPAAGPLLDAAGVTELIDDGYIALTARTNAVAFIEQCRNLRLWSRGSTITQT